MHRSTLLTLTLSLAILLGRGVAAATLVAGDQERTLEFGGVARAYRVHVPAGYDGTTPVPLVLDFHGLTSNAAQQAALSGFVKLSETAGFIVAHPDGLNHAWNAGVCCGNAGIDDVGFVRAVVAAIVVEGNVDATRVYATGLSNGGAISQRLACEAADLFAAAAPLAFPLSLRPLSACQPSRSMPILTFMGLTDALVHYEGGLFASAPDTFAYWRDVNGCRGTEPDARDARGASRCETYTRCQRGAEVGLCSITARAFPGAAFDGHILYLNPDYDLAEVAWAFLSRFRLPAVAVPRRVALAGPVRVKLGRARGTLPTLEWTLSLGAGTWTAEDAAGNALTGSWVRRGRTGVLSLTGDSRATLLALLASQASPVVGRAVTVGLAARNPLLVRLDGQGMPRRLIGRFTLTDGAATGAKRGLVTVRLGGR